MFFLIPDITYADYKASKDREPLGQKKTQATEATSQQETERNLELEVSTWMERG